MNCASVRKRLPLFVGGDLDAGEQTAVEVHLGQCLDCFRQSKAERASLMALHGAAEILVRNREVMPRTGQFAAEIMGQIHGPPPSRRSWVAKTLAVSGWAAALVLGALLWSHGPAASPLNEPSMHRQPSAPTTTTNTGFPTHEGGVALDDSALKSLRGAGGLILNADGTPPRELSIDMEMSERYLIVRDY